MTRTHRSSFSAEASASLGGNMVSVTLRCLRAAFAPPSSCHPNTSPTRHVRMPGRRARPGSCAETSARRSAPRERRSSAATTASSSSGFSEQVL